MSTEMTYQGPIGDPSGLYKDLILDYSKNPKRKGVLPPPCRYVEGVNPFCGDHVTLYIRMNGDTVEQVRFQGEGCAISTAAASIICVELEGLSKQDALSLLQKGHECVLTGKTEGLEESRLTAFSGVHEFPNRVKCASMSLHVAKKALEATLDGDAGFVEP